MKEEEEEKGEEEKVKGEDEGLLGWDAASVLSLSKGRRLSSALRRISVVLLTGTLSFS